MVDYKILVKGSNFKFVEGTIGFANLVLVESTDGLILFDTGHYNNRGILINALQGAGLAPDDISAVVLSHLHYDHCVNVDLFPKAHVYLSQREWDYAESPNPKDLFIPWKIRELLGEYQVTLIDDDRDIAKGVHFFQTPGHTPGSSALALETKQGTVVLAGDAIKYPKEMLLKRPDMAFDSEENGRKSITKIMEMADIIVPGHFGELCRCEQQFIWEEDSVLQLVAR
ncbi:MAG: N-acyl homoserine lactonase family protein [SAR324 cluster bacterium]|nr:N-acyl homoserine lactonase family protein [SAR324 cluster bacterium]